jgi:hydrogenase maturation protease
MSDGTEADMSIRVIGMGNVLMGDDGFGPNVIAALLACCDFSDDVSVMDLGTPGLDLTPYVVGADALIIVDTVNSRGAPGEMRLYRKDQILKYAPQPRLGPHDPGLKEALFLADLMGCAPQKVLLVGVIPERTETGPGLTDAVRHAVSPAAFQVIREIEALGGGVKVRATPCPQEVWWESRPTSDATAPPPKSAASTCMCEVRAAGGVTVRPLMSPPRGRL